MCHPKLRTHPVCGVQAEVLKNKGISASAVRSRRDVCRREGLSFNLERDPIEHRRFQKPLRLIQSKAANTRDNLLAVAFDFEKKPGTQRSRLPFRN